MIHTTISNWGIHFVEIPAQHMIQPESSVSLYVPSSNEAYTEVDKEMAPLRVV